MVSIYYYFNLQFTFRKKNMVPTLWDLVWQLAIPLSYQIASESTMGIENFLNFWNTY